LPLLAVETLQPQLLDRLPNFKRRLEWFMANRPELGKNVASLATGGHGISAGSSRCWMASASAAFSR
jgi:hypothetical protein